MRWGMFSPDQIGSNRRQQTLELGAVIRHYNDRAVPGLGGLWYGMPMAWALLGIWLAEERERRPLPTANAVEALVMSRAIKAGGDHQWRASGLRKLVGRQDHSFKALSARGAYVTQPRRMGTVQPLVQLGFVQPIAQRFNLYRLSDTGAMFLEAFETEKRRLLQWHDGGDPPTLKTLWPSVSLPAPAAALLCRQLQQCGEGAMRRRALFNSSSASTFAVSPLEDPCPRGAISPEHWADLRSGVAMIRLRDAATAVLAAVEHQIVAHPDKALPLEVATTGSQAELAKLRKAAGIVMAEADTSPGHAAHNFAGLCQQAASKVLLDLARRDGAVVRAMPSGHLGLGAAGGEPIAASPSDADDSQLSGTPGEGSTIVPELPRIANFYALKKDLATREAA